MAKKSQQRIAPSLRDDRDDRTELYRRISVRMYADGKYQALSKPGPSGQALWWYLLTGPHTNLIPGLFTAGRAGLAEALGWEQPDFDACWDEISTQKIASADWKARVVWIPKAIEHNKPASPSVVVGWRRHWPLIPECNLKWTAFRHLRGYLETEMGAGFVNAFVSACLAPAEQTVAQAVGQAVEQPARQAEGGSPRHQEQYQEQYQEQEVLRARSSGGEPELQSEVGLGTVLAAYEKQNQGVVLAGRELLDVRSWLARGVKPERFAEAITVIGEAMRSSTPEHRPKAFWKCVVTKIRDTPADQPIVWHTNEPRLHEKPAIVSRLKPAGPPPIPPPPKDSEN